MTTPNSSASSAAAPADATFEQRYQSGTAYIESSPAAGTAVPTVAYRSLAGVPASLTKTPSSFAVASGAVPLASTTTTTTQQYTTQQYPATLAQPLASQLALTAQPTTTTLTASTPAAVYSSSSHYMSNNAATSAIDKSKVCVTLTSPKEEETAAVTLEVNNASAVLQNIVATLANRFPPESVVTIQGGNEGSSNLYTGYGVSSYNTFPAGAGGSGSAGYSTSTGYGTTVTGTGYGLGSNAGYGTGGIAGSGTGYSTGQTNIVSGPSYGFGTGLGIGGVPGYGYTSTSTTTGQATNTQPSRAVSNTVVNTTTQNTTGYPGAFTSVTGGGGVGNLNNFATTSSYGTTSGTRFSPGMSAYPTLNAGGKFSNGAISTTVPSSTGYGTTTNYQTTTTSGYGAGDGTAMRGTSEFYANEASRGGTVVSQQQLASFSAGAASGEENIKYVEVEVETEVIKEVKVPVYETVIQEKKVPVVQEKVVEVEDLRVEFVTREVPGAPEYVTQWKDQEKIITQTIDVPKIVQKPVKKTITKEVPRPIEQIIEQPVKKIVNVEAVLPKVRETEQAVVVAQSLRPVLRESATDRVTVAVKEWEFTLVHVDIPVPKAVAVQILVGGVVSTEHRVVSVGAAQWNSLIRVLNGHLLEKAGYEVFIPYYRQGSLIPFLPNSERMEVISPLSNEWMLDHRQGMYHVTDVQGYTISTAGDIHRLAIEIANRNKQEALRRAEQQWHSQTVTTTTTTTTGYTGAGANSSFTGGYMGSTSYPATTSLPTATSFGNATNVYALSAAGGGALIGGGVGTTSGGTHHSGSGGAVSGGAFSAGGIASGASHLVTSGSAQSAAASGTVSAGAPSAGTASHGAPSGGTASHGAPSAGTASHGAPSGGTGSHSNGVGVEGSGGQQGRGAAAARTQATQSLSSSAGTTGNIRSSAVAPSAVTTTMTTTQQGGTSSSTAMVPLVSGGPTYPSSRTSNSVRNDEGSYKEITGQLSHASSYQDLPGHFNTGLTAQS